MLTPSTMLPLGTQAPTFFLPDVKTGERITIQTFAGKLGLLVMFICNHCPYVQHVKTELVKVGNEYKTKNVGVVAISSNDIQTHPDDSPENLKKMSEELGFNFPFCYDESQQAAISYRAVCTPDFFLFDKNRKLVYRGQLDDSRPGNNIPLTGNDLRSALDALLSGQPVSPDQKPSTGCSIKWKKGNEPK